MIKALLLVFNPGGTWDRIVLARRRWFVILLIHVFPLLLIANAAEGYGLIRWGKPRGEIGQVTALANSTALVFEILQLLLMLIIVFVCARLIKAMGETFHGRHSFTQGFTVAAYGLCPLFALHTLDILPGISSWLYWVVWIVGILLCSATLYHGIPRVMLPDPPHAFGLYVISSVLLAIVTGLLRFVTYSYLEGKFGNLDVFIAKVVAHLPALQSFDKIPFK